MKKYLIIAGLAVIVICTLLLLLLRPAQPAVPTDTGTSLPVATSTSSSGTWVGTNGASTTPVGADTLSLAANGGGTVVVKDFLHDGDTAVDVKNPGTYYLAGPVGYCLKDGSCPAGAPSTEYHIAYNANDQAFIIALVSEPLGTARADAQTFLESALGASQPALCSLKYYVGTDVGVSDFYAGKNLGFSFCPGATTLPN